MSEAVYGPPGPLATFLGHSRPGFCLIQRALSQARVVETPQQHRGEG